MYHNRQSINCLILEEPNDKILERSNLPQDVITELILNYPKKILL